MRDGQEDKESRGRNCFHSLEDKESRARNVLHSLEDTKNWVLFSSAIAAVAVLLGLLLYDICKARISKNPWVPSRALLINALCLTLLGVLSRPFGAILEFDGLSDSEKAVVTSLLGVVLFGQRAMMCVFTGYLLPTMGNIRQVFSKDMLALLLTLGATFYDALMECYVQWLNPEPQEAYYTELNAYDKELIKRTAMINTGMLVTIIYLAWILGCSVLAAIAIEDIVNLKLCRLVRNSVMKAGNPSQFVNWQEWRSQMLGLCIMARTFQPSYLIARSSLASSTFFAVTVCSVIYFIGTFKGISCLIFKGIYYLTYDHNELNLDLPGALKIKFMLWVIMQFLFVFCGWFAICQRWMQSLVISSKVVPQNSFHLFKLLHLFPIENFWVRTLCEIQQNCKLYAFEDYRDFSLVRKVIKASKLHNLFRLVMVFQFILVWSSKFGCLISKVLLHPKIVATLSMGFHAFQKIRRLDQQLIPVATTDEEEFYQHKNYLLILEGESSAAVWIANSGFINKMRQRLDEAKARGNKCTELKALLSKAQGANIENSCFRAESYLYPLTEGNVKVKFEVQCLSIKMILTSLLAIIFEVSAVYKTVIQKSSPEQCVQKGNNVQNQKDLLENCIKAIEQAWDIMSFLEALTVKTKRFSNTADDVFRNMMKRKGSFRWMNHGLPITETDSVLAAIQNLKCRAEEEVQKSCRDEFDCKNWNQAVPAIHMRSICNKILKDQATDLKEAGQIKDFIENLERSLASIVKHGILETIVSFDQFWDTCNDYSKLDECKICKMCCVMAMVFGILEES